MEFIETAVFSRHLPGLLSDEGYADLQSFLAGYPEAGRVIRGSHGLRKIRWPSSTKGQGKRGGVRVIYYRMRAHRIYMLDIYGKGEREDLSERQVRSLVEYIRRSG